MEENNYPLNRISLMYQQIDSSMSLYMQQELSSFKQVDKELTSLYRRFKEFHEQISDYFTPVQGDLFERALKDFEQISDLRDEIGFKHSLEEYLGISSSQEVEKLKFQLVSFKDSYSMYLCDLVQELDTTSFLQGRIHDFLLETYKLLR